VVDLAVSEVRAGRGVALFDEFPNEGQATLAGLSINKAEELLAGEVARMRRD